MTDDRGGSVSDRQVIGAAGVKLTFVKARQRLIGRTEGRALSVSEGQNGDDSGQNAEAPASN